MEYVSIIVTVAVIHLLAVMSPGIDFAMITRNSLTYSRRTGVYSAIGLGLGVIVHLTYCLLGIALIISQSIVVFSFIKLIGSGYILYLGYKSLTSNPSHMAIHAQHQTNDISRLKALRIGFLTNVLNPKVTLFFLSLFTLVISPSTPLWVKLFMGAEMSVVTALWFTFVAFLVSHHFVKSRFQRIQHIAEKFIGVVLIGLGIKVALSTIK